MSVPPDSELDTACGLMSRQGPVHARLSTDAQAWQQINGYQVCTRLSHPSRMHAVWLCEVSHRPRLGIKGRGAAAWLTSVGVEIPGAPNRWQRDADAALIARLGAEDFLICDAGEQPSGLPARIEARWQAAVGTRGYLVPRQDGLAHFLLGGPRASEVMARLCAVDLRTNSFAADAIAQTQVALTSALILHAEIGGMTAYRVFVDTSLALYLWDQLVAVTETLGGQVIGTAALPPN